MKDIGESHARLRSLFNITVTPFKADGSFDFGGLARNIECVIGLGFDGILVGTYGEFPFRALAREFGQPQTTKAATNLRGFDGGSVRLPLRDLEPAGIAKVAEVLRGLATD